MVTDTKVYNRKAGGVVKILVELEASQAKVFNETINRLGMSKRTAIGTAISIWLGMVNKREVS